MIKIYKPSLVAHMKYVLCRHLDLPNFGLVYFLSKGSNSYCACVQASPFVHSMYNLNQLICFNDNQYENYADVLHLNNKLNIYQQKYNTICKAGATLTLFNISHILIFCRVTDVWTHISSVKHIFAINIFFHTMAIRVMVIKHDGKCTHK
jgi:hypothetical protein